MNQVEASPRASLGLFGGFGLAVVLRVIIGGRHTIAYSALAGLIFAACLVALSCHEWPTTTLSWSIVGWGLLGAAVLLVPVLIFHESDMWSHGRPAGSYLGWALVVSVVAAAEEVFLRGRLYAAVQAWLGVWPAIVIGAVAFAALHVPLYGWHVVPLDLAVGLWLGALRHTTGSWTAPAIAHTAADLAAWWII